MSKKIDWEIYDEDSDELDIHTYTRKEAKAYQKKFPKHKMKEIDSEDSLDAEDIMKKTAKKKAKRK